MNMDEDRKVVVDFKTIKALSVDARLNIIRAISDKPKTLTDLSDELGLAASTIKEHLESLVQAALIEREETDRKWKYYTLTRKGERIVGKRETNTVFLLFTSIFFAIAGLAGLLVRLFSRGVPGEMLVRSAMPETMEILEAGIMEENALAMDMAFEPVAAAGAEFTWFATHSGFIVAALCVSGILLAGFFVLRLRRKHPAQGKDKNN
ncbi:MAG TPA: ArsR family transcriptional regulator [Candidatus Woesearchaeota archaeon]|nr:ArsR family transcriptional regulator [Candidatus Woesearchaeota archaeon]